MKINGRLCVLKVGNLREEILGEAHEAPYAMHPGTTKMYRTLRPHYWWPTLRMDVAGYVAKCPTCQLVKIEHQAPAGKLRTLPIPEWKWDKVTMDFITGLLKTLRRNDTIWVVVDHLTKTAHFLSIRQEDFLDKLTRIYVNEIVRLHGTPRSVILDRDSQLTSHF